ncbi:MAG TPA: rod shape-determining protein MreC [Candidatus Ratteibacteria bacterium]|nr:rod shape-determining protein MreC [Candidatus Ratteibacteria bacterium]
MIWRFRKEILFLILIYFSFLINKLYFSRNFSKNLVKKNIINYSEIINENERLKKILKLNEEGKLNEFIVGRIINFIPSLFPGELVVDKGQKENVETGMVVITDDLNLVGKVERVEENVSYVSTIFNSKTKISSVLFSTGEVGIIEGGTTPFVLLKYISSDSNIKIGDEVLTSGYSKSFPAGIKIGKVVKIEKETNSLFLKIYVKPYCMYSYIKEVLIGKERHN